MTAISIKPNIKLEIREFLKIAIPLASAQIAQAATGFIDTVMMGWLGAQTLAAGGLAAMTFTTLLMTISGIVSGVSPMVAQAYGARHQRQVGRIMRQGLWLAMVLAIPGMLFLSHLDVLMLQLGQASVTVNLANTYLDIMVWGLFPALGFTVLRSLVSSLSQARPVMIIVIVTTLFNAFGNYVLAFGKFGFPKMELAGLAVASVCAHWIMFLSLLVYALVHKSLQQYHLFQSLIKIELKIIWELLWVGLPIGVITALEYGLVTVLTFLMGMLGTNVLAAHQIVLQTMVVIFMIPLAMSYATTIRVARWMGQQNYQGARQAGYLSMGLGGLFMAVTAIALLFNLKKVIGLYLDIGNPENADVVAIALPMLAVASCGQILDGVQRTANGALQGLKDTRVPMLLSLIAYWGIGLTSGYLLGFYLGLGGVGLWVGQSIGFAMGAGFFIWRFRQVVP